jgi:hypothetical protein
MSTQVTTNENTVNVTTSGQTVVVQAAGIQGPQGPTGADGAVQPTGSFAITGSNSFVGDQIITGSLIISGSSTFTNIGPAIFSGSITATAGITGSFSGTATSASFAVTASHALFAVSASHEVTFEISSSHAKIADQARALFGTPSIVVNDITASGIVSASGNINGQNIFGGVFGRIYPDSSQTSNNQFLTADVNGLISNASFNVTGNITASGNISASSATITALTGSFNHIITDDDTIEFRNRITGVQTGRLKFDPTTGLNVQDNTGARTKIRAGRGEFLSLEAGVVGFNSLGSITASVNISASGTVVGSNLSGTNTGDQDLSNLVTNSSTASFAITGSDVIFGNITSSGNISASGDIVANNLSGTNTGDQDLSNLVTNAQTASFAITGSDVIFGNITASGNISASSTIIANGLDIRGSGNATTFNDANITNVGQISLDSLISDGGGDNQIILNTANMDHRINDSGVMTLKETSVSFFDDGTVGHITASGNISASNTVFGVTGSFNQISSNPASIKTNITMGSSNIDIGNTSTAASLGGSSFPFTKIAGSTNFQGMVAATNFLVGSGSLGEALGGIPVNSTLRIGGVGTGFLGTTYTVGVDITGNVTASGGISASGDIVANKVTADVVDTSFETFLNFEAATAFTFIAPFGLTVNFTGSSTASMDVVGFVTASANTDTFSSQQPLPITLNQFDKLKITPAAVGLFIISGSRTI